MKRFRQRAIIEAQQITDSDFDAPHPNPSHVPGVLYDPVERRVEVITSIYGLMYGWVGYWIARYEDGSLTTFSDSTFRRYWEACPTPIEQG